MKFKKILEDYDREKERANWLADCIYKFIKAMQTKHPKISDREIIIALRQELQCRLETDTDTLKFIEEFILHKPKHRPRQGTHS